MEARRKFQITGLILGFFLALTLQSASASLLIEPHVGYNLSASGNHNGTEIDYNGPQYGARLGYQNWGFMAGLDYTRSGGNADVKIAGVTSTRSIDGSEMGVFAGYEFPILIRVWGAYYFSNKMKLKGLYELSGNTKELGVGFTALPFLSINFMYRMVAHDETKTLGAGLSGAVDFDFNEIVLGVSLPFTLL